MNPLHLVDVYEEDGHASVHAIFWLYELLRERKSHQSISHKEFPTSGQHIGFVFSRPYLAWYIAYAEGEPVGAVYITKEREIGVHILNRYQEQGFGPHAVRLIMEKHSGKFLANINPENLPSIRMFERMGFKHIQNTYCLE